MPGGGAVIRSRLSIRDLENALAQALEERDAQAVEVEAELGTLSRIYERLRNDYEQLREERDRAIDEARLERERRAKETLELAERLVAAAAEDDARPVDADALRERFVTERLAHLPTERRRLGDGQLPEVQGFRVLGVLGHGGMATVYRAARVDRDEEVAIKLLHEGPEASKARSELFLREAAVMLQLDHPGLVRAVDAGECAYGRYLVLEMVTGESLAARVRREGPFLETEAIRIALQVARALSWLARLGLTHRDVKPSNLLADRDGRVRLCDFGLAALSRDDPARPYGSPGYAAPEQLTTPGDVDERADIYALGCTLWHLVVGRRPFTGPARSAFEEQRLTDLPDPRFEGADISPRLAQVVRRMGRRDRESRYRRWDECLLDLMLVEKGNPPFAAHLAAARDAAPAETEPPVPLPLPREKLPDASASVSIPSDSEPQAASPSGEILPPPAPPLPHVRVLRRVVAAAIGVAVLTAGYVIGTLGRPPSADTMQDRARTLAAQGRTRDAAAALRQAALLLPDDEADRLRWLADSQIASVGLACACKSFGAASLRRFSCARGGAGLASAGSADRRRVGFTSLVTDVRPALRSSVPREPGRVAPGLR